MINKNDILTDQNLLTKEEAMILCLRALYKQYGYTQYNSGRFEEYSLYAEHKAFLPSDDIITFTGVNGKLMALRPDVTLSIVRSAKQDSFELTRLYYNENVYRSNGNEFKEQMQVGLECIGEIDLRATGEVIMLAKRSLDTLSETGDGSLSYRETNKTENRPLSHLSRKTSLDISHMGFINGIFNGCSSQKFTQFSNTQKKQLLKCISEKNVFELNKLCKEYDLREECRKNISALADIYGSFDDAIVKLRSISINDETDTALNELETLRDVLQELGVLQDINLDFSIVNDIGYYDGIIFQGFIEGIPTKVLSGGRYDMLMRKFNNRSGAIGFAVYLNLLVEVGNDSFEAFKSPASAEAPSLLKRAGTGDSSVVSSPDTRAQQNRPLVSDKTENRPLSRLINIALPKGRLGDKAYAILEAAGYDCAEIHENSRRLIFESPENGVRYFWVKPSDVAIYVQRGVADIGIVGKDILLEQSPDVYELIDMGIGKCRVCVAAQKGKTFDENEQTLRVVTIFPNIARDYYEKRGRNIDIIKLHGSIELAPLLELGDVIVDIVETGKTLLENDLEPIETITDISARLIANKVRYRFNHDPIIKLCAEISKVIQAGKQS